MLLFFFLVVEDGSRTAHALDRDIMEFQASDSNMTELLCLATIKLFRNPHVATSCFEACSGYTVRRTVTIWVQGNSPVTDSVGEFVPFVLETPYEDDGTTPFSHDGPSLASLFGFSAGGLAIMGVMPRYTGYLSTSLPPARSDFFFDMNRIKGSTDNHTARL
jgi:hypothetical protein